MHLSSLKPLPERNEVCISNSCLLGTRCTEMLCMCHIHLLSAKRHIPHGGVVHAVSKLRDALAPLLHQYGELVHTHRPHPGYAFGGILICLGSANSDNIIFNIALLIVSLFPSFGV